MTLSLYKTFYRAYKTKPVWLLEHSLFIMLPLAIIISNPTNTLFGYIVVICSLLMMVSIAVLAGARPETIGLTKNYFVPAMKALFLPNVAIAAVIITGRLTVPQAFVLRGVSRSTTWQYLLLSVPIQELLFRGLCLWRCRLSFHSTSFVLLFNSADFASYHIIFRNWWLTIGVFLVSLLWSRTFLRWPNLYAPILSHAILGTLYFSLV